MTGPDLTTADAAKVLNCSTKLIVRLAVAGELRAYRLGRRWRFTPGAIDAYRHAHAHTPAPSPPRRRVPAKSASRLPGWDHYDR